MRFLIVAKDTLTVANGSSEFTEVDWHVLHLACRAFQLLSLEQVLVAKLVY